MVTKRNELILQQKYQLIKEAEKDPTLRARKLAEQFHCGKTQVCTIIKNKASMVELYESNAPSNLRRCSHKRSQTSQFTEVNDLLYEWYLVAVRKNIYPDGLTLCEKAREIVKRLELSDFKASNGWLEKWKARHNIKKMIISGESGEVSGKTVESWKERLPEIVEGYKAEDIWNMDESGCFWKALPDKGLAQKGKSCKGGKKSKQRITVAFFVKRCGRKGIQTNCYLEIRETSLLQTS